LREEANSANVSGIIRKIRLFAAFALKKNVYSKTFEGYEMLGIGPNSGEKT